MGAHRVRFIFISLCYKSVENWFRLWLLPQYYIEVLCLSFKLSNFNRICCQMNNIILLFNIQIRKLRNTTTVLTHRVLLLDNSIWLVTLEAIQKGRRKGQTKACGFLKKDTTRRQNSSWFIPRLWKLHWNAPLHIQSRFNKK